MKIKQEKIGDVTIITLPGNVIDAENCRMLKEAVLPLLPEGSKVVFDMSELEFVDSSGCGFLISCLRRLTSNGGNLHLCSLRKPVQVLLELVRIHRIVEVYNTREEALASYQ